MITAFQFSNLLLASSVLWLFIAVTAIYLALIATRLRLKYALNIEIEGNNFLFVGGVLRCLVVGLRFTRQLTKI